MTTIATSNLTNDTITTTTEADATVYYDDTLDIFLPLVVGVFVALALLWMVVRYKMANDKAGNYSGSIYCCPERCFTSMSRLRKRRVHPIDAKLNDQHRLSNHNNHIGGGNKNNRASQVSIISNNELGNSYDSFRMNNHSNHRKSTLGSSTNGQIPTSEYPLRTLRRDTIVVNAKNSNSHMPSLFKFSIANFKSSFPNFQRNSTSDDIL